MADDMPRPRTLSASIPVNNRSRVGNGSHLLEGIKLQSAKGRRFRELVEGYKNEFEIVSIVDADLIRLAAALVMKSESLTAAMVNGEQVSTDEMARLAGQLRRVLTALKQRSQSTAPAAPSLLEHLASQEDQEEVE
jgi:hypothetical protein